MIKASLIHEKSKNDEKIDNLRSNSSNLSKSFTHIKYTITANEQMSEKLINTKINSIKDRKFNFTLIIFHFFYLSH